MADMNNQFAPPPPPPVDPNAPKDRKNLAIGALICGIASIVFSCLWYLALPLAIAAIVMGAISMKSSGRGLAIGGIICGSVGIVLSIVLLIIIAIGLVAMDSGMYL
jgi:hypothetical protein